MKTRGQINHLNQDVLSARALSCSQFALRAQGPSAVIWIPNGHSVLFRVGLANTKFLLTSEEEIAMFSRSGAGGEIRRKKKQYRKTRSCLATCSPNQSPEPVPHALGTPAEIRKAHTFTCNGK